MRIFVDTSFLSELIRRGKTFDSFLNKKGIFRYELIFLEALFREIRLKDLALTRKIAQSVGSIKEGEPNLNLDLQIELMSQKGDAILSYDKELKKKLAKKGILCL